MTDSALILLGSFITLAIPILVSFYMNRGKKVSGSDWAVGGRDLPLYVVIGTQFATALGGAVLVAVVGMGYDFGLTAFTYSLVGATPFFIMIILAPWIRQNNFTTIPDVLQAFYGENRAMAILSATLALIVPFGWVTSQLGAFGALYSQITGLDKVTLAIGVSLASLFLVLPSGLKTVAWTDFILSCLMITVGAIVLVFAFDLGGGPSAIFASENIPKQNMAMPEGFYAVGGATVMLWFASSIPGGSTNQIYYQRVCSIKDPKRVTLSLVVSGIAVYLTAAWAGTLGITIKSLNPNLATGQEATGWLMTQLPTWLLVMFGGLICSAVMSTISSAAQTVVTNITNDILPRVSVKERSDREMVVISRVLAISIMALACVLSIVFPVVLNWLVYTYAFSAAGLLAPMFVGYFTRNKKTFSSKAVVASMVMAMIVCVVAQKSGSFGTPVPFTLYGVLASVITMYGFDTIFKEKNNEIKTNAN